MAPMFIPRQVLGWQGRPGANDRIRVGVIGVGTRGNLLIDQLPEASDLIAVSDCDSKKYDDAAAKRQAKWRTYQDYRNLLDQKDIDGVIVATNEHWHVLCAMHACQAGKDVYCEKPLSLYVQEGRALVNAARKLNRVVQVGSQQRSMAMNRLWPIADGISPKSALAFRYASGVSVRLEVPIGDLQGGAIFVGEKGRIEIIRNMFRTDPPQMVKQLPPPQEVQKWRDDVALWQAKYHMQNWLDCMRTREKPLADVEIGHRSATVCHLANITRWLGRRLRWDPAAERFIGDDEANGFLTRARRKGYELPAV